ncbi:MAG: PEP-CTERM sorting domain-containing protein [Acidobacteriaceae bacterium]|nr:PEP-CTERM sorting domain-containing protein [Acidobacteriaceae bacterium]
MKSSIINRIGTALAIVALAAVSGTTAKADIITSLMSQSSGAGTYAYTFDVYLTGDEMVNSSLPYSQFGTLYDLSSSAVSATALTGLLATNFTFTSNPIDTKAYLTNPPDGPAYNLRYTFHSTGGVSMENGPTDLGTFTVSFLTPLPATIFFDGQAGKNTGTAGNETGNVGSINIPGGVPEPASILLLGSGLLGVGFIGRRRLQRSARP